MFRKQLSLLFPVTGIIEDYGHYGEESHNHRVVKAWNDGRGRYLAEARNDGRHYIYDEKKRKGLNAMSPDLSLPIMFQIFTALRALLYRGR